MKKTRILATLLCIMMLVCSLPVLQVSAAEGDSYASVDEILGTTAYEIPSLGYEFDAQFVPGSEISLYYREATETVPAVTGTVAYTVDGMTFDTNETSTIWYTKTTKAENPFRTGTATAISVKFTNDTDKINIQFNNPHLGGSRVYADVSATQIKSMGGTLNDEGTAYTNNPATVVEHAFGTEWNDLLFVLKEDGHQIYVKNASTDGKWLLLIDNVGYRSGSTSGFLSLSAAAGTDGAVVKSITHYGTQKPTGYATMEEATGIEELATYGNSHVFTADYNNANAKCYNNAAGDYGEVTYTDNGMALPTDKNAIWNLSGENPWMDENVTVMKAKFGSTSEKLELQIKCPGFDTTTNYYRAYIVIRPGQITSNGVDMRPTIGTEWFELMVWAKADGHTIYLKNKYTENLWQKLADVEGYAARGPAAGNLCIAGMASAENNILIDSLYCYKEVTGAKTIEEVMGVEEISNAACNHVFTGAYNHPDAGCHNNAAGDYAEVTYTADGMSFPTDKSAIWRLAPASNLFKEKNGVVVRAKLGTASDAFDLQLRNPSYDKRVYVNVSASQVKATGYDPETDGNYSETKTFNFGTDWFELLVLTEVDGHAVYVKNDTTVNRWLPLLELNGYRAGSPAAGQLCIAGKASGEGNLLFGSVSVYHEVKKYNSIADIIGSNYSSTYAFDFDADTILPGTATAGFLKPEGTALEADGLTLKNVVDTTEANRNGALNFLAFDRWSALNSGACYANEGTTYIPQAFYMEMKGAGNVQLRSPNTTGGRVSLSMTPGSALTAEAGSGTVTAPVTIAEEWTEYLVVPNTEDWAGGYTVYVKGASATGDKWLEAIQATEYQNASNSYAKLGIQFTGLTGHVRKIRTYAFSSSVAEADTTPAGAGYAYFKEEFDAEPTYINKSFSSYKVENGYLNSTATVETGMSKFYFNNVVIPVGGYAEFKLRNNGSRNIQFFDGEQKFQIYLPYPYGSVTGGTGYLAESANLWRTWRIVRTAEGYSAYSKVDGDAGWYQAAVKAAGTSDTTAPLLRIDLSPCADGVSPSSGQIDYIRVFGATPTEAVTLTDGYSSRVVANGDALKIPTSLRVIVGEGDAKLFLATYSDDILVKVQMIDTKDLENGEGLFDVSGGTAVKVFLWEDTNTLKNLNNAIELSL